jgi:hypothetical protein
MVAMPWVMGIAALHAILRMRPGSRGGSWFASKLAPTKSGQVPKGFSPETKKPRQWRGFFMRGD